MEPSIQGAALPKQPIASVPKTIFATFNGTIDQAAVGRLFQALAVASQNSVSEFHLLFQTDGGAAGQGIVLYNYFRGLPLSLHVYNAGYVASAGVLAFLGVCNRYTSAHATFMIHRAFLQGVNANASTLSDMASRLAIDDRRAEAIMREATSIPKKHWRRYSSQNVYFDAQEALQFGIASDIREFKVPQGHQVFNL
jgi:ATP-dependent protease ClpP protease subunit